MQNGGWLATEGDVRPCSNGAAYPPNEPAVKGRAAIRAWLEKFPPITEFKLSNVKVEGCEDLAYVLATYTMTIAPPGAPGPVKDSGKYVSVVRRQADGAPRRRICSGRIG